MSPPFLHLLFCTPISDAPPERPHLFLGDMWLRTDGQLHVYDGSAWVEFGPKISVQVMSEIREAQRKAS